MKTRVEWGCPLKLHSRQLSNILSFNTSESEWWMNEDHGEWLCICFISFSRNFSIVCRCSSFVHRGLSRPLAADSVGARETLVKICSHPYNIILFYIYANTHIHTHFQHEHSLSHISVQLLAHRSTFNSYTSDAYLMHHTFRHCRQPNVKSPFLIKETHWCFSVSHFHVKMFSIIYRKSVYALFFFVTWGWFWPPVGSSSSWIVYATYTWTTNRDTIALRFQSVFNCMCQMEMKWLISDNGLTHRGPSTYFLKM